MYILKLIHYITSSCIPLKHTLNIKLQQLIHLLMEDGFTIGGLTGPIGPMGPIGIMPIIGLIPIIGGIGPGGIIIGGIGPPGPIPKKKNKILLN